MLPTWPLSGGAALSRARHSIACPLHTPLLRLSVGRSVGQGVLHFLPSSPPPFPPVEFGGRGVRGKRGRGRRRCRCVPGGIRRIGRRRRGWRDLGGLEQSERGNGYPRSAHSSNKGMPLTDGRADGRTDRSSDRSSGRATSRRLCWIGRRRKWKIFRGA